MTLSIDDEMECLKAIVDDRELPICAYKDEILRLIAEIKVLRKALELAGDIYTKYWGYHLAKEGEETSAFMEEFIGKAREELK
jgi:hypothetical protein